MSDNPRPQQVLVVDDSPTTTAMLRLILQRSGYEVRIAHTGRAALDALAEFTPDLVLCDIEMPDVDGFEVLRTMRATEATRGIPVILVTSRTDVEDKIRGLDTGATDYVTKPFKMEELNARIRSQLRVKALSDELLEKNAALAQTQVQLEEKIEALRSAYQKIAEHQQRTQKALDLASKVQRGLLPPVPDQLGGHSLFTTFRPAEEVAGDFYDFLDLGDGHYGVAVGDVAGKGVAASLVMVLIRTVFRSIAHTTRDPAEVLARVNRTVISEYGSQDATTMFYGVLDARTGCLTFSNAGHEFPVVTSADGRRAIELCVGGPFLGIFARARYNRGRVWLSEGDRLTLFTDGLYCLPWRGKKIENGERVLELLRDAGARPMADVMSSLLADRPEAGQDDITLVRIEMAKISADPARALGSVAIHNSAVNLREVRTFVGSLARAAGLPARKVEEFSDGLGEVVANAVHHAYEQENSGLVEITVDRPNGALRAEVVDQGRGFTPAEDKAGDDALPSLTGGGLRAARSLLDTVDIQSRAGAGTRVTLTKRL